MAKKLEMPKIDLPRGSLTASLPLLGVPLLLLAGWFGYSAFGQFKAQSGESVVLASRDQAVNAATQALTKARNDLKKATDNAGVQAAAAAGTLDVASQQLKQAGNGATLAEVLPADLNDAYSALPGSGYGKLAVAEEALATGKPALRIIGNGKARLLAAAQKLPSGHIALLGWPATPVETAVSAAKAGAGYLALRQGGATIAEAGDMSLKDLSESKASKVAGSELRIAAGAPPIPVGPFGLGLLPSAIATALLALGGLLLILSPRLMRKREKVEVEEEAMTLDQMVEQELGATPPPVVPDSVPLAAAAAASAMPPPAPNDGFAGSADKITVDPGIFRAYDIRGVVGKDLNENVARGIGLSIASVMREQGHTDIVVGRDGRLSGPALTGALIEGLRAGGRNVIDIGMAPTPLVYFAAYHLRAGSCVAVTGSHNPPDYNGFKIVVGGETLSGDSITDLYRRIAEGRLPQAPQPGTLSERDVSGDYVQRVASDIQLARTLKVVVDAGNGAAGELGPRVLEAIGAEVTPLYCDVDGTFPNHHPDPSEPHNLEDLKQVVERTGADIGLAFDGDGDRLGVITPKGHMVFPDRMLMLFAADVLDRNPGAVIVYDVKCSGALMPFILRHGGSPLMWKTGHSLIKHKMRETEAELAGEMSGHFFFKERWFGFDDGIYSAARLLEILSNRDESVDEVFAEIPEGVSTPEIKVPVDNPHAFVERVAAMGDFEGARSTTIDGLRADWPDGWGLVRASNTTPVLVLRFEGNDQAVLKRIQQAFRERLLAVDPGVVLGF